MGDQLGGYEWGWTCGGCDEFLGLAGMGYGSHPTVNDDQSAVRTRGLEGGDTLECPECGHRVTLRFEEE